MGVATLWALVQAKIQAAAIFEVAQQAIDGPNWRSKETRSSGVAVARRSFPKTATPVMRAASTEAAGAPAAAAEAQPNAAAKQPVDPGRKADAPAARASFEKSADSAAPSPEVHAKAGVRWACHGSCRGHRQASASSAGVATWMASTTPSTTSRRRPMMGSKPVALQRRPMKGTYALEERTRAKYDHICNGDEADCRHARQRSAPRNSINSSTPSGERAERNEGEKRAGG